MMWISTPSLRFRAERALFYERMKGVISSTCFENLIDCEHIAHGHTLM